MRDRLFIGNLGWRVKEVELKSLIEVFTPVKNLEIIKDKKTKKSKGYGFLTLMDDSPIKNSSVISLYNGRIYCGRKLIVELIKSNNS